MSREYFPNNSDVEKYKVMCGVIINEAFIDAPDNVLTNIVALGRNTVASETWSLIATFESEQETLNCKKCLSTAISMCRLRMMKKSLKLTIEQSKQPEKAKMIGSIYLDGASVCRGTRSVLRSRLDLEHI